MELDEQNPWPAVVDKINELEERVVALEGGTPIKKNAPASPLDTLMPVPPAPDAPAA